MGIAETMILAVGLSMDAFAVSICKGLALPKVTARSAAVVGAWFGAFQGLMPLLGYFLGTSFQRYITAFDHWIAFVLLAIIGGKMVAEAFEPEEGPPDGSLAPGKMLVLAVATSIDALALGITLALLQVEIALPVVLIACTTFVLSFLGVRLGNVFGLRYKSKAELVGGVVLILLGVKILLEHLGILG